MTAVQQWWFGQGKRMSLLNYGTELARDNPLVWWTMDDETGTMGADSGSLGLPFTILDPSIASFGADPLWSSGSSLATLAGFNGVQAPHNAALNFTGGFTVTALVKWTPREGGTSVVVGHGSINTDWSNWQLYIDFDGHVTMQLGSSNSLGGQAFFTTTAVLSPDTVARVAARWDSISGAVTIWIDDDIVLTDTWAHTLWDATSPVGIGSLQRVDGVNMDSGAFVGIIDEIAIYDAALTDARIHTHWLALHGSSPAPQYHSLREDGGNELREDGGLCLQN